MLAEAQLFAPDLSVTDFTTPSRNFPGQGYTGVNPPDTVGDVGPNHYIQSINSGGGSVVRIYDKAEPVPNTLATFNMDSMGSSNCVGSDLSLSTALPCPRPTHCPHSSCCPCC